MSTRGRTFLEKMRAARSKIAALAAPFVQDRSTILTHSFSRVVRDTLFAAAEDHKHFTVYVTESAPDYTGRQLYEALEERGISVTLIVDSAVGYILEKVDMVLLGAEGVVESGGIINKIGTYTMAMCAKEKNIPIYVLAESFKFARKYPLNQKDLPDEQKYPSDKRNGKTDLSKEHPMIDYTPPAYITLLFTDLGILTPLVSPDNSRTNRVRNVLLACVAIALGGFMVLALTGIRNTEKIGQQSLDQNTDLGVDTTERIDAFWSRGLGRKRRLDGSAGDGGEKATLTAKATAKLPGPYALYEDEDAVAPVTDFASTEVVATTTANTTASTAEAIATITADDRTTDVEGGTVLVEQRKRKRLEPMPLMCVFGGNERSRSPLPEDGLCDLAYFDSFYRSGLLDTFARRRHSAAFERFVTAAAKYRLTEVGVAVASEGNSKAQEELSSSKTWASLRKLWNSGIVHFGVLDFEVAEDTTPEHVDHIFDLLFVRVGSETVLRVTTCPAA
ncbi:hypothetical protein HPB49_020061 [Dermacentor silvarum]|uniref:Uncharacterized protein n=1 Tax=Dermacentor silvarum TaxID=543639 RepID=A0ACB8CZQ2_DERSI|nr:hypothetical protein HPB49_020061 [Dermacentor silvarum]